MTSDLEGHDFPPKLHCFSLLFVFGQGVWTGIVSVCRHVFPSPKNISFSSRRREWNSPKSISLRTCFSNVFLLLQPHFPHLQLLLDHNVLLQLKRFAFDVFIGEVHWRRCARIPFLATPDEQYWNSECLQAKRLITYAAGLHQHWSCWSQRFWLWSSLGFCSAQ